MSEQKVVKIDTGLICLESFPCQHNVTVYYDNNTKITKRMGGKTIVEKYWSVMTNEQKRHFDYLTRDRN